MYAITRSPIASTIMPVVMSDVAPGGALVASCHCFRKPIGEYQNQPMANFTIAATRTANQLISIASPPSAWATIGPFNRSLQTVEQRCRQIAFGKRGNDQNDVFSLHLRPLADLNGGRDCRA